MHFTHAIVPLFCCLQRVPYCSSVLGMQPSIASDMWVSVGACSILRTCDQNAIVFHVLIVGSQDLGIEPNIGMAYDLDLPKL
jgi:recombinational DNA repair protein RecT